MLSSGLPDRFAELVVGLGLKCLFPAGLQSLSLIASL